MLSSTKQIAFQAHIRGIGIDLEENKRIGGLINKWGESFIKRVFTDAEIAYCKDKKNHFASFTARFAAKEALLKALGTGLRNGLQWKDIELINDEYGKPYFNFFGKVKDTVGNDHVFVSISHTVSHSTAVVVIEKNINKS